LSSGTPTASAKSLATDGTHYYVAETANAPSGAFGASAYMDIWHPFVNTATGDIESLAQIAVFNGSPTLFGITYTKDIEVGWVVAPGQYGDYAPHLFVYVRDFWKGGGNSACLVQNDASSSTGWSCGFVPFTGANDWPGEPLILSDGTVKTFYTAHYPGCWLIQYDANWIGCISDSWFNDGHGTFTSVAAAQWQGEVDEFSQTTYMGNGNCGTKSNSAHIYTMGIETTSGTKFLSQLHPVFAHRSPQLYNGKTFDNGNSLAYGGPTGCP